jgi:hypothetical protein
MALAAAGAAWAMAAGCGDDGDAALTKDEYIDRGDEICAEANERIEDGAEELFSDNEEPSAEEVERFTLEVSVPTLEAQIQDLRALSAPEDDRDELSEIYDDAEEGIAELREDPSLAAEGELPDGIERSNELASEYGFTECGEEG